MVVAAEGRDEVEPRTGAAAKVVLAVAIVAWTRMGRPAASTTITDTVWMRSTLHARQTSSRIHRRDTRGTTDIALSSHR